MDTQNISAQIFTKQLPPDARASYYGCKNDLNINPNTNHLTTCVDYIQTDKNIENAFQKQMDLADYYKSKSIFNSMKKQFQDQTMEGMNATDEVRFPPVEPEKTISEKILPVGPRDTMFSSILSKEFFGKNNEKN